MKRSVTALHATACAFILFLAYFLYPSTCQKVLCPAEVFVKSAAAQTAPRSAGPTLTVDVGANRHPISPDIYGINFADEALTTALNTPVRRWGGNATTRYNWQNDTSNRAADWFFENIPNENANPAALPAGSASDRFVEQDRRTGSDSLLTVPLIGWTPKSREISCGFRVAKYGSQQYTDPYRPDCGNGVNTGGQPISGNDPGDTSVAIEPAFVQGWIEHLIAQFGSADAGGVAYYNLDNEPMLWHQTHRDVHPQPVGYDELRDRTYAYAAALKQIDPSAQTLGPATWGWTAYFYSAQDSAVGGSWWNNPPDRNAHGGVPLTAWYLQQMQAYEQQQGVRILDYLDLHYYPQAAGVTLAPAGDANTQALRLRSTRALWDPTYVDESWIGEPVRLIPRMREWVDQNYPGTKLAITEYNWGGLEHINGALAQADVLGIFGREGLDLATLWDAGDADQPYAYAFRIYRNYDGANSTFGDISVEASSTEPGQLSIYAAQRSSDGALTLVVINKSGSPLESTVNLSGFDAAASAQVYTYSANNLHAIVPGNAQPVSHSGLTRTFPASSITLMVLPSADSGPVATPTPADPQPTAQPTATAEPTQPQPTAAPTEPGGTIPTATPMPPATSTPLAPAATPIAGVITGRIFVDANGDGEWNAGEQPLRNAIASLTEELREIEMTAPSTTGADGVFRFSDVPPGEYIIRFDLPLGYVSQGAPEMPITVGAGTNVTLPDFGVEGQSSDIYLPVIK